MLSLNFFMIDQALKLTTPTPPTLGKLDIVSMRKRSKRNATALCQFPDVGGIVCDIHGSDHALRNYVTRTNDATPGLFKRHSFFTAGMRWQTIDSGSPSCGHCLLLTFFLNAFTVFSFALRL